MSGLCAIIYLLLLLFLLLILCLHSVCVYEFELKYILYPIWQKTKFPFDIRSGAQKHFLLIVCFFISIYTYQTVAHSVVLVDCVISAEFVFEGNRLLYTVLVYAYTNILSAIPTFSFYVFHFVQQIFTREKSLSQRPMIFVQKFKWLNYGMVVSVVLLYFPYTHTHTILYPQR